MSVTVLRMLSSEEWKEARERSESLQVPGGNPGPGGKECSDVTEASFCSLLLRFSVGEPAGLKGRSSPSLSTSLQTGSYVVPERLYGL